MSNGSSPVGVPAPPLGPGYGGSYSAIAVSGGFGVAVSGGGKGGGGSMATPRAAFKLRTPLKLGQTKGDIKMPMGTRIAGREAPPKIRLERLLATDAERLSILWFATNEIPFDFETSLLGGRIALQRVECPFLLSEKLLNSDYQAMRLYEQNDGRHTIEGELLTSFGYQLIDLSPTALINDVDKVLGRALEFYY
jgi:hypothetical protein